MSILKEQTILALSNLLNANVDSGLKFSLSMGYDEDPRTRTAFMQVLTNILNQGTEFEDLAETSLNDRYEKLIDLLMDPPLVLINALCDVCPVNDMDEVASVLLALFQSRTQVMILLKTAIEREVQRTDFAPNLFRRNSIASKLLAFYSRVVGEPFLRACLTGPLKDMMEGPTKSYEIDPNKISTNDNLAKNLANLKELCVAFIDSILGCLNQLPP